MIRSFSHRPQKIVIIDGQGGRMGKAVIEKLHELYPEHDTYAIGTNSILRRYR